MQIISLSRFSMEGSGPASGDKTRIVWIDDQNRRRVKVYGGHIRSIQDALDLVTGE